MSYKVWFGPDTILMDSPYYCMLAAVENWITANGLVSHAFLVHEAEIEANFFDDVKTQWAKLLRQAQEEPGVYLEQSKAIPDEFQAEQFARHLISLWSME